MAGRRSAPKRADVLSNVDGWLRRNVDLDSLAKQAELAKKEALRRVAEARRNLTSLGAQITADPRAAIRGRKQPASARPQPASPQPARSARSGLSVAKDQALAGLRGAQDALTLGMGDRVYAGSRALLDAAHGVDVGYAWQRRWAAEQARDEYDRQHYKTARTVGQVAGTAASSGADRSRVSGWDSASGGGLAAQGLTDLQRGRVGSFGDYAGSGAGGALTALASVRRRPGGAVTAALNSVRGAPGRAAALGGATTSIAQDVFNGNSVSFEDAQRAALAGRYVAAPLGLAGRAWSKGLSISQKGKLGEALGKVRTVANFDLPSKIHQKVPIGDGSRSTIADHITRSGILTEQKFGKYARLSKNQLAALNQFGTNLYRVDHFLPEDVGRLVAYPVGLLGYQAAGNHTRNDQ